MVADVVVARIIEPADPSSDRPFRVCKPVEIEDLAAGRAAPCSTRPESFPDVATGCLAEQSVDVFDCFTYANGVAVIDMPRNKMERRLFVGRVEKRGEEWATAEASAGPPLARPDQHAKMAAAVCW